MGLTLKQIGTGKTWTSDGAKGGKGPAEVKPPQKETQTPVEKWTSASGRLTLTRSQPEELSLPTLSEEPKGKGKGTAEAMEKAMGAQEQAGEAARDLAAAVQLSGAQDIERAKAGKGLAQNILVDAAASSVQMIGDAAANAALGTPGSMIPFAARAFGGGTQEARAEGADLKHQMLYGGAMAAKEVFTEKMSNIALPFSKAYGGGALDDAVERAIGKAVDRFAKTDVGKKLLGGSLTFAASALSEGAEEFVGDWMEWQMPRIYGGDPDSAAETLQNSLYDFLVGAASGAMGGVVNPATYNYEVKPLSLPTPEDVDVQKAQGTAQEPAQGVLQQEETRGPPSSRRRWKGLKWRKKPPPRRGRQKSPEWKWRTS